MGGGVAAGWYGERERERNREGETAGILCPITPWKQDEAPCDLHSSGLENLSRGCFPRTLLPIRMDTICKFLLKGFTGISDLLNQSLQFIFLLSKKGPLFERTATVIALTGRNFTGPP